MTDVTMRNLTDEERLAYVEDTDLRQRMARMLDQLAEIRDLLDDALIERDIIEAERDELRGQLADLQFVMGIKEKTQ